MQVMVIAVGAVSLGLVLGAAIPFLVQFLFAGDLPAPAHVALYARPLLFAAIFGLFSALAFAVPPLARAREITPASLFRDIVAPVRRTARLPYITSAAAAGAVVIVLALYIAPSPRFAEEFLGGAIAILFALHLIAVLLRLALKHAPRLRRPRLRLAIANLTRPGATTAGVITALGLGLTLLATVALLDNTISTQVKDSLPETAPSFFFVDIQPNEVSAFDATIHKFRTTSAYQRTPMIRGRIVALKGVAAKDAKVASDSKWALPGDRGISYAAARPDDAKITEGSWWPANYTGPTLISFEADLARGMGLKIGDRMTLNVLGREIEGRIANLRDVNFRSGRQNFILILSPGLIDKAPHTFLASVRVDPPDEEALYRAVTDRFPNVSTVRVRDAIAEVNTLLQELAFGVRTASFVTIIAGLLVLAGAIASGARARLYDATVLKVVGATRAWLAGVFALEYGLLGLLTGALGLGAGTQAAYLVAREIFEVPFAFNAVAALLTVFGGGAITLLFGLLGAWTALAARPARQFRAP
jgi:putative ABC transport system permease protein